MIYSKTSEYALRALAYLSARQHDGPADVHELSRATDIPAAYIAKVCQGLANARILTSKRGPGGGFQLTRDPSEISLMEIVVAMDDVRRLALSQCVMGLERCSDAAPCPLHPIWSRTTGEIKETLNSTSVRDLASLVGLFSKGGRRRRSLSGPMRRLFGHARRGQRA